MKKLANHIILSGVTVSMLFSPLMAINPNQLPSGGKFTHGTSGTISGPYIDKNTGKNTIDITGKTQGGNHVIQWGGGFNIGNKAQVNFIGNDQNYLNIAHGTSKSTIEGLLNAGGNNVFLINPNGVIITKTGTINANRFVASTSSMSDGDMTAFANMKNFNDGLSFSPVFKPQKAGNVVNMGNINANDVLLIGNKVDVQGGKIGNANSTTHLVGKNVYIDVDTKLNSTINVTATDGGYIQRQMIKFAEDKYNFGDNVKVNVVNYKDSNGKTHKGSSNFKKALTIGNMRNEKDNAIEWWHFAKGWNEGLGVTREIDEFRLVGDIDFSGNQGKGVESKDWQNYANYCIDGLGCTSMIVGITGAFNKIFDGQGFTLKNLNINAKDLDDNKPTYVGIFGYVSKATFKNINVDYMGGSIVANALVIGGFIGHAEETKFNNILLININNISNHTNKSQSYAGGFGGLIIQSEYSTILLKNIKNIISYGDRTMSAGFVGAVIGGNFSNIILSDIENIKANGVDNAMAGSFAGDIVGNTTNFYNISIRNISSISGNARETYLGGFSGAMFGDIVKFENINMFFDSGVNIIGTGSETLDIGTFVGGYYYDIGATFSNIHIYHHENDLNNATADKSYWGNTNDKIQIHTYNDNNQESAYKDFLSNTNTIEKPNHSDVSLEEDDLNKEVITQIIEDITQKGYVVDIAGLEKLLEDYSKFNLDTTEGDKIAFIQEYFNIKDENEARGILQSLDFLTYYTKNETFDKNRISNEAKDL
ncbi:TPA: filamentous hemagglutinin N-terminal domain-containing protein, partial [Campylobacter lari]|nr:filamentous hemagglutinin N-terminal domain-containing protein [Campylobacter lari]